MTTKTCDKCHANEHTKKRRVYIGAEFFRELDVCLKCDLALQEALRDAFERWHDGHRGA